MKQLVENIDYKIEDGVLTIFEGVNIIPPNQFKKNKKIYKVYFPSTLKHIGSAAFYESNLEYAYFNDGLETIGSSSFFGTKLNNITLPNSVYNIGTYCFAKINGEVGTVVLSDVLKIIPPACFKGTRINNIDIPNGIVIIGREAFDYSWKIGKIVIPSSVLICDINCFNSALLTNSTLDMSNFNGLARNCIDTPLSKHFAIKIKKQKGVYYGVITSTLEKKVSEIKSLKKLLPLLTGVKVLTREDYEIDDDKKLTIKEGVEVIPKKAFSGVNIRSVVFPSTLKIIEQKAFSSCNIKSLVFPDSLLDIGEDAFENNELESIVFGKNLLRIGQNAFFNHKITGDIQLPDSLLFLGNFAFESNINSKFNITITDNNSLLYLCHLNDVKDATTKIQKTTCVCDTNYFSRLNSKNIDIANEELDDDIDIEQTIKNNKLKIKETSIEEANVIGNCLVFLINHYIDNEYLIDDKFISMFVAMIQHGANINYILDSNEPLIIYLYKKRFYDLINILIEYGADINLQDNDGYTLLMYSIQNNDYKLFNKLIKLNAKINILDNFGNNALVYAVLKENYYFIDKLIFYGSSLNIINNNLETIESIVYKSNNSELIEHFEKKGYFGNKTIDIEKEKMKLDLLLK